MLMLTDVNENSNGQKHQIGFNQSYNVIFINDKVVTFEHIFDGGLGGVGWGSLIKEYVDSEYVF